MAAQAGVSGETTIVSTTVEQVLTVASEVIGVLLLVPFWPNLPAGWLLAPLLAVPFALLGLHPRVLTTALRLASRLLKRPLSATALPYPYLLLLLLWYVGAAAVNGLAFLLVSSALGVSTAAPLAVLAGSYLLARVLGFLSFITPAGIGVREAVLVGLLTPYLSLPVATMCGLSARLLTTAAEALMVLTVNLVAQAQRRSGLFADTRL